MDKEFLDALASFTAVIQKKFPQLQAEVEKKLQSALVPRPLPSPSKHEEDVKRRNEWKHEHDERLKAALGYVCHFAPAWCLASKLTDHAVITRSVPLSPDWANMIESVLYTEEEIHSRLRALGEVITRGQTLHHCTAFFRVFSPPVPADYAGKEVIMVGLLNGAFMFVANLLKYVALNYTVEFMVRFSLPSTSGIPMAGPHSHQTILDGVSFAGCQVL